MPSAGNRALPRLSHLGLPVSPEAPLTASAYAGLGALDVAQNDTAGGRVLGGLALAYAWDPSFGVALDVAGHNDGFGDEMNGYGEPRLTARYVGSSFGAHHWGAEIDARFVGAEVPSLKLGATSPSARALYAYRANERAWIAAQLGFHLNRSDVAIPTVERLSGNDKRTLAASSWNGIPWGLGGSYALGATTNLVGELSGEWLVGKGAPSAAVGPVRVSAAVKQGLSEDLHGFLGVDLALSSRRVLPEVTILNEEPRLTVFLGVSWLVNRPEPIRTRRAPASPRDTKPEVAAPVEPPAVPAPAAAKVSVVSGSVVDEGGRPLADVEVVLVRGDEPARSERTLADGRFEFPDVAEGAVRLEVNTEGFDLTQVQLGDDGPRSAEIVLRPAVPAGQIRGKVLDLQGNPVGAQVTVASDDGPRGASSRATEQRVTVAADGSFELDLPPGRYVVRFEHPDFAAQRRTLVIKDKGVVILNIALIR